MVSVIMASPSLITNNPKNTIPPYEADFSTRPRTDSSSSYLNHVRESFAAELENSIVARSSFQTTSSRMRRNSDDGEIDVFGAERYFNSSIDASVEPPPKERPKTATKARSSTKSSTRRSKARTRTASMSSEASSNSQSMLLRDWPSRRNQPVPNSKKHFLGVFRCPCSGKSAVDVEGQTGSEASSGEAKKTDWLHEMQLVRDLKMERLGFGLKEELHSFAPNSNFGGGEVAVGKEVKVQAQKTRIDAAFLGSGDRGEPSFRRSFTALTPVKFNMFGQSGRSRDDDDDAGSESSSDLFEIKNLLIDSLPPVPPTYPPSEASIEWSVITASAAEVSVASERDDVTKKAVQKHHRSDGLSMMSCVSHKSVDVTTAAAKTVPKMVPRRAGAEGVMTPGTIYRMEGFKKLEASGLASHRRAVAPVMVSDGRRRRDLYVV